MIGASSHAAIATSLSDRPRAKEIPAHLLTAGVLDKPLDPAFLRLCAQPQDVLAQNTDTPAASPWRVIKQ
jgi:hypothetical protein